MARPYLLDTSALMAWLGGEPGAERVRALLLGEEFVLLPWPALVESYYLTARSRGAPAARERYATLRSLPATLADENDESIWLAAATLKANHRLSIADALIAALARRHDAVLVHKDPEYEALTGELELESLEYKPKHRTPH